MVTIAEEWLNSCSGCEVALLNLGEALLDLLPQLEFVHMPILMDNKYYGPLGSHAHLDIPEAVVGIVSGGVRNTEHLEVLRKMRERVKVLVALGTCAATGGLPGLGNLCGVEALQDFSFDKAPSLVPLTTGPRTRPDPDRHPIPRMLPQCTSLAQHVAVDLVVPGCPPHPEYIAEAILSLLEGRPAVLPDRSVCSMCPTRRTGHPSAARGSVRRMLEQPVYDADKPLSEMQCLLEQGFMCLGPVTLAGCGGRAKAGGGAPKCIAARTPCRGCQGPICHGSLVVGDYMGALAAVGSNGATMPDKPGYLSRYHMAHASLLHLLKEDC